MKIKMKNTILMLPFLLAAAVPAGATIINIDPSGSATAQSNYTFGVTGTTVNSFTGASAIPVFEIDSAPLTTGLNKLGGVVLTYNSATDTLTLSTTGGGTGMYGNITAATNLLTFTFNAPLTVTNGSGASTLVVPKISNITANANFLTDLGISSTLAASGLSINSFGISGNVAGGTFTSASTVFLVTTPEPMSLLLFGSGLGLVGFLGRKKINRAKPQA
jgi:hypothetical protein